MIEINAAVFILVVEALAILSALIIILMGISIRKKRRKNRAIAQLVVQIRKQSEVRTQETGSFLQDIYQLEDSDLKKTVETIDKSEKLFFQKLIESYQSADPELITAMDASIAELIDVYKELKPKELTPDESSKEEIEKLHQEVEKLGGEKDRLKEELTITKTTMGNMISEFGSMFGGGADHELANFEVVEKVESQADTKDEDTEK